VNLWNLWWFRHALVDLGQNPFTCQNLFYPYGADLWLHTMAPLSGLAGLALQSFMPLVAAQNLLLLIELCAAGLVAQRLARHVGLDRPGAFLAGCVFAFCPALFGHLYAGHFELIATFWMPWALLLFLRLTDSPLPRARDAVALGLVLAGAAYSCQYYAVYSAELLAVAAAVRWRDVLRPAVLRGLALACGIAAAGMAPILWTFLRPGGAPPEPSAASFDLYAGDLAGFVLPSFQHPLLSGLLRPLHERLLPGPQYLPQEATTYVGVSVLVLGLLGVLRRPAGEGPALSLPLAIATVFCLLSLGGHLRIGGWSSGIPLPAALLARLPVLGHARAPGRHVLVAMLGLGMLAGLGFQRLRGAWSRLALIALLVLEYVSVPIPLSSTEVSPAYRRLAEARGSFALLELPLGVRDGQSLLGQPDARQVFAQTVHGHPIVGGMVSRLPPETWRAIVSTPVIGTLLHPTGATETDLRRDLAEGAAFFARWQIRAVLVHPEVRSGPAQRYVERVLPIQSRELFADGSELLWIGTP
jgi:hypothetical protein